MADAESAQATEQRLRIETEAAKRLIQQLQDHNVDDDADLLSDAIEGETELLEALRQALEEIDESEVISVGLKAKIDQLTERKRRVDARIDRIKALIEQALVSAEQATVRLVGATLTARRKRPGLIVRDEASIPSRFFIEQERPAPKLNKPALLEELRAGNRVTGADLDNGSITLSIRRT